MFSRCCILPDTSASENSQGNSFTGSRKQWKQWEKGGRIALLKLKQDVLLNSCQQVEMSSFHFSEMCCRKCVFIIKCLPSETKTGRICLAVSCWMAACVCFWKASLASHLQGSSTTTSTTFTASPGESKFHISVTAESEKAHKIAPFYIFQPACQSSTK